jgi:hypothetical protein
MSGVTATLPSQRDRSTGDYQAKTILSRDPVAPSFEGLTNRKVERPEASTSNSPSHGGMNQPMIAENV